MKIRAEQPEDHDAVAAIHDAAFGQPDEARIVAAVRSDATLSLSLVAELEQRVVAHVLFSTVVVEDRELPPFAGLGPVSVIPGLQRRGIGSTLIRHGLEACPAMGWRAVFVLGDPSYYGRFGFDPAAPRGLHYGSRELDHAFQVLELEAGVMRDVAGWVQYHPAFAGT